jgi:beta-lactam-binding protein with PASTA domain
VELAVGSVVVVVAAAAGIPVVHEDVAKIAVEDVDGAETLSAVSPLQAEGEVPSGIAEVVALV